MVLSSCLKHCESSPGSCDECATAQSGSDLITQPESWYSFYRPTKGRKLSRSTYRRTEMVYEPDSPQTVTHPVTNRARRSVTTLIETNTLLLSQATTTAVYFVDLFWQ